jgi:nucleotide-binding universal stress UspA family protein
MVQVKKVVIPVDFTSTMDKVVDYAVSIADQLNSKILFLHVINDFQGYDMMLVHPSFELMKKDLEDAGNERMGNLVKEYENRSQGVSGKVVYGDAGEEIVKFAADEDADMIIIGTHGAKGLERILMGSTAEYVVKKAPCPILTFNPFK